MKPVSEQIRQRMQETFGAGYDYTYLYPGMQKVVRPTNSSLSGSPNG